MVLGITGGVGAGKSRILDILREVYGARIIQADQVAAELEQPGQPGYEALVETFGAGILNREGQLDRAAFAQLIFQDSQALSQVNGILHPLTWRRIRQMTEEQPEQLTAVESALFDRQSRDYCGKLVFVDTDEANRISRLMENRGYSREKCLDIMKNQPDRETFLSLADYVIDNNGSLEQVRAQVDRVMEELTNEVR
ncbi:MAG: dephospho-CoA kinase [Eubacteriales bacterium]|nr:dephospho-CoA kinase [Eubacteriales bacterium]